MNNMPEMSKIAEILGDKGKLEEYAKLSTQWIQKRMKEDQK